MQDQALKTLGPLQTFALLLIIFVDGLGTGIVLPMLPALVNADNPASVARGWLSDGHSLGVLYGLVLASYALAMTLGAPLLGSLSDRIGRRDTLVVSVTGMLVAYALSAASVWIGSALVLIASRLLCGAFAGSIPVAQALLVDAPGGAMRGIGRVMFAMTAGFFVGPMVSGLLLGAGAAPGALLAGDVLLRPLLAALVLSALCLPLALRLPHDCPRRAMGCSSGLRELVAVTLSGFASPATRWPFVALLCMQMGWSLLYQYLPLVLDRAGRGIHDITVVMTGVGAALCVAFVWLAARARRPGSARRIGMAGGVGFAVAAPGFALLLRAPAPVMAVCAGFAALAYGLGYMGIVAHAVACEASEHRGRVLGIVASIAAATAALAGLLGGLLSSLGAPWLLLTSGVTAGLTALAMLRSKPPRAPGFGPA